MIASAAVLSGLAAGCTVLEDRLPCPCYLDIDYDRVLQERPVGDKPGRVEVGIYDSLQVRNLTRRLSECPDIEEVQVEKAVLLVVGLVHDRPLRNFLADGSRITYEPGNQIDSLFVHTGTVDCTGEEACCLLEPSKQFSTLFFTDSEDGDLCRSFNMVIRGSTCGFDAADLSAVDGEYLYTVQERDAEGRISVRIPRQVRSDLMLEFWDKDDHLKRFSCPVGLHLFDAGYDPSATSLQDYEIRIDFREGAVWLRVAGWTLERRYALYDKTMEQ
ncbi:MAG: hypothetical protein K6G79_00695 [Bacteroidales bacterium]|nr:hypothetical protein [Bacteroidales bacterium]